MSEEQTWLLALPIEQLGQACKAAGVRVDGFRSLTQVPRLLLERQIMLVLGRQRGPARSIKLRSALGNAWRERYPALHDLLKAGLLPEPGDERPPVERWGEWLVDLCRTFGRAPVQMGMQLLDLPWADQELVAELAPYLSAELPLIPVAAEPDPATAAPEEERRSVTAQPEWRQERNQLRARLKSLAQENQALQRARTSAEYRAAHYQAQVEQVRAEMEQLANREDWPQPKLLVQRLIRGLMEARRQILDLELANHELRRLGQEAKGEPSAERAETEAE